MEVPAGSDSQDYQECLPHRRRSVTLGVERVDELRMVYARVFYDVKSGIISCWNRTHVE